MVRELDSYDVWLLINGEDLFPFSTHGLEVAQGSFRSILGRSHGSLFFTSKGEIVRIGNIKLLNDSLAAKAKRLFGGPHHIEVSLVRESLSLPELKEMLINGLRKYHAQSEYDESWRFAALPLETSTAAVLKANSTQQLFTILELPRASDCLDLL